LVSRIVGGAVFDPDLGDQRLQQSLAGWSQVRLELPSCQLLPDCT